MGEFSSLKMLKNVCDYKSFAHKGLLKVYGVFVFLIKKFFYWRNLSSLSLFYKVSATQCFPLGGREPLIEKILTCTTKKFSVALIVIRKRILWNGQVVLPAPPFILIGMATACPELQTAIQINGMTHQDLIKISIVNFWRMLWHTASMMISV